jgi:hypothetical protein
MDYHAGIRIQQGRGIGSILGGLFKFLIPAARTAAKTIVKSPLAKNVSRSLGNEAKKAAINIALDALQGKNVKQSAQSSLNQARSSIAKHLKRTVPKEKKPPPSHRKAKRRKLTYSNSKAGLF